MGNLAGDIASKIFIGVVTAAIWLVLSHASRAGQMCPQICNNQTCLSTCQGAPNPGDGGVNWRDGDRGRHDDVGAPEAGENGR